MTPMDVITEVLSSEEEIRLFCKTNEISDERSPLFRLVIEAFLYLQKKIEGEEFSNILLDQSQSQMPINGPSSSKALDVRKNVQRDDVSNRKRPSTQDCTHENQIKIQKKSESTENDNIEEITIVKLENTENENIKKTEIEEHSPEIINMSNQAQNFETSGDQIANYSGNDMMSCEIKVEEDSVHDQERSSLILNSDTDFFTMNCDVITVIEVTGRAGGLGKNPILIVTQNGNTYRCNKRTKSDKTKKGIFCSPVLKDLLKVVHFDFKPK